MVRRPVDIIIPVYKGYEVTKSCIESVLASENTIETNIYVINDASPESELNDYLAWLSENAHVTVLHNTSNLGFPRTVNKGFRLNPDHDVILLNSDTLVFSDWADRMARAAYSSHDIGTVTPFSNNATICSYPFINKENPLPTDISPSELDGIFKRVNVGGICKLPTGVGFCMYIKRECLDDVGDFDEELFGRGYGEENDFCFRAHAHGWHNVLAADVFVPHVGGSSFGGFRNPLLEKNLAALSWRFKDYQESIRAFVSDDPALVFRRAIDEQLIALNASKPLIVRICHSFGGGTAKRLQDEAVELLKQEFRVATLRPSNNRREGHVNILFEDARNCPNLHYDLPGEINCVLDLLTQQNIKEVLLHHFLRLDPCVLDIPNMLGTPYKVIVHDYAWYCQRINLIDYTNKYCGEPDSEQCQRCVDLCGGDFEENITTNELMKRSIAIMENATMVIAPCEDTADRLSKRFEIKNVQVLPHEQILQPCNKPIEWDGKHPIRIAIIGEIGQHKGYDDILMCARDAATRGLPIEYCIIGITSCDCKLLSTGKVFVTGKYNQNDYIKTIAKHNCHISLFLSKWPETWCYALSDSFKANLNAITVGTGSLSERNSEHTMKVTDKFHATPKSINDYILSLFKPT